jgi:hypothetical protein
MLEISGRKLPFSPADKGVLTTAGEFSDTLVEMADDEELVLIKIGLWGIVIT